MVDMKDIKEAPERLYSKLETEHLEDGSKKSAHQRNDDFLKARGQFQQGLGWHLLEAKEFIETQNRKLFNNEYINELNTQATFSAKTNYHSFFVTKQKMPSENQQQIKERPTKKGP